MATSYPTSKDTLTNPTSTNKLNSPSHADQHANANDAVEALQDKLGIGSTSQTATSGKLLRGTGSGSSAWDKDAPSGTIVGTNDSQNLTNKTINADVNTITNIGSTEIKNEIISGQTEKTSFVSGDLVLISDGGSALKYVDAINFNPTTYLGLTDTPGTFTASKVLTINSGGTAVEHTKDVPSGTIVGTSDTQTLTNKTLTSPVVDTGVTGTAVLDDDTFATASSTTIATSESIKAYADTMLPLAGGTLTGNVTVSTDQNLYFGDTDHFARYDSGEGKLWVGAAADNKILKLTYGGASGYLQIDQYGVGEVARISGGNLTLSGTVDGRDIATDGTKLDTIETNADVTDTANVTSAGALMDSEVDADIKTLALPANTTISAFGASLVDDADAATARATLDVDQAGTDNSTNVSLSGTGTYLSLLGQVITVDPITESDVTDLGTTVAMVADNLSVFANTTSAQLAGIITDETGTGALVFGTSPTLTTPNLGTPSTLVGTNITGTAASLTAGAVSTITGLAPDTATTQATQPNITSAANLATVGTITTGVWNGTPIEGTAIASTGETGGSKFLREDGDGTSSWVAIPGGGDALTANPLSQFAATTSAQFAGVISDETGTGSVVLSNSPTIVTPTIASLTNAQHNHTNAAGGGTLTASAISDFDTEVSNNTSVAANTAKVTNATHTGDVTGSTVLTIGNDKVTSAMMLDGALANHEYDDNGTGGTKTNAHFETGWGFIDGGGSSTVNEAVTFPTAFTTILGVSMTMNGAKTTGDPSAVSDTNNNGAVAYPTAAQPSTTGFTAVVTHRDSSSTLASGTRYIYSWFAWGTKT